MIIRGDVYFVDLAATMAKEQGWRRPVLVVSDDAINRQPLVATVVVGTDSRHVPADYPTNVRVAAQESGLPRDTVFLCFQVRSLDPAWFVAARSGQEGLAGRLPAARMAEVEQALRLVLGL